MWIKLYKYYYSDELIIEAMDVQRPRIRNWIFEVIKTTQQNEAKNMSTQNVKTVSIVLLSFASFHIIFLLPIYDAFQREIDASGAVAAAINWYFYVVFIDITLHFDNTNKVMNFYTVLITTKRFYSSTFFYWFRLIEGWREKNSNNGHL